MTKNQKCKVKICGLKSAADIETANHLKPDYIGFVFAKSKRQVTKEEAKILKSNLDINIQAVGVFVDENIDIICQLLTENIIDIAQLHGTEDENYIQNLKQQTKKPVIKAISVKNLEDVLKWQNSTADFLLLDNGKGGTGEKFNWQVLENSNFQKPYFLAGGLTPQNVTKATKFNPYAVDVSGGVETNGTKDKTKIEQFITNTRKSNVQPNL